MSERFLGRHFILELYDCDRTLLDDRVKLEAVMTKAAELANATIVNTCFHHFSPYGISGTIVIQESHFNIHTWPEHGFAAIDLFTCGESIDPEKAKDYLVEVSKASRYEFSTINRGKI